MADVFLSYARPNAKKAAQVAARLREQGYSLWFDTSLPAHRAYSEVIEEELDSAAAVLVLWSSDAVRSQWVRSEANRARETGRLVQARLDSAALPMPFDQIQCADLSRWRPATNSSAWHSVVDGIAELAGGEPRHPEAPAPPGAGRRRFLLGSSAAAVAIAGAAAWRLVPRHQAISPEAQLYLQKGTDELQSNDAFDLNDPASLDQAITLLTDATHAAPDSAEAWGALSMAYAARKKASGPAERPGLDARSRSAAKQALELDHSEARALGALRMLDPVYRRWLQVEQADRDALKLQPEMPLLLFLLGDVYASVGRWNDAAALSRKFDRSHFLIAGADRKVVVNLWSAGDLQGADDAMRIAVDHWPRNPYVWRTRIAYLMYSGRPADALTVLGDRSARPPDTADHAIAALAGTARALAGEGSASPAIDANLALLRMDRSAAFSVVHACAALGDATSAFDILEGYYFGQGRWAEAAPAAGDEDRVTSPLFQPPMRSLWTDRRFAAILNRTGLNEYWRQSRTMPDFRRLRA